MIPDSHSGLAAAIRTVFLGAAGKGVVEWPVPPGGVAQLRRQ
ncbi:hypothetical protein [Streptomyces sioyaensis]